MRDNYGDIQYNKKLFSNEKDFNDGDYSFVDISRFSVITSRKRRPDVNYICRRIKNAWAYSIVQQNLKFVIWILLKSSGNIVFIRNSTKKSSK